MEGEEHGPGTSGLKAGAWKESIRGNSWLLKNNKCEKGHSPNSHHLRRYPHTPVGTYPKCPPPPEGTQRTRDTKQNMQTRGHMNHKKTRKLPVGIAFFLPFFFEHLTLKSCTCSIGALGMDIHG